MYLSAERKTDIVLRLLRGEAIKQVSRDVGVPEFDLNEWQRVFVDGGKQALRKRGIDAKKGRTRKSTGMVSREEAWEIARHYLEDCRVRPFAAVGKVLSINEIEAMFRPPLVFGFPRKELRKYWIAYLERQEQHLLTAPSEILLISKSTGEIVYAGSANDEG